MFFAFDGVQLTKVCLNNMPWRSHFIALPAHSSLPINRRMGGSLTLKSERVARGGNWTHFPNTKCRGTNQIF